MKNINGNWEVVKGHGQYLITEEEKEGSYIVATTFDGDEKALKKAKLIASAPELLDSVKSLMETVPNELRERSVYSRALSIIKKATE